eukprot:434616_1
MGTTVSKKIKEIDSASEESGEKVKADLNALVAILNAKEDEFKAALITPNDANLELPIDTIVKMCSEKTVNVSTGPSKKMNDMVESLFGGEFLNGMKGLILGALEVVLGNASGGEKTKQGFTVMLLHSAIVRVDYYLYAYTVSSDGLKTDLQNGLVFVSTISTVKVAKASPEAIALLAGLTAESSLQFFKRMKEDYKRYETNIAKMNNYYELPKAIGLIIGNFGDTMSKSQKDDLNAIRFRVKNTSDDTKEGELIAKETIAANSMLSELAAKQSANKTDLTMITQQQLKLLDQMIEIYHRVNEVKSQISIL